MRKLSTPTATMKPSLTSPGCCLVVQAHVGRSSRIGWWSGLAALLANVAAFYGQFSETVQAALTDGLKPLEKQLQVWCQAVDRLDALLLH
jgi:hypothetical protein